MNYFLIYANIVLKAKNRNKSKEYEGHHSVPKHWFNENKTKKDYDYSIVYLTPREHFLVHKLLCKIFPNSPKAKMALCRMMNTGPKRKKYNVSAKEYENMRRLWKETVIAFRTNPELDAKRRKIASKKMKELWKTKEFREKFSEMRQDAKRDQKRKDASAKAVTKKHLSGEMDHVYEGNKNLDHMTEEQKCNMQNGLKKWRKTNKFKQHMESMWKKTKGMTPVVYEDGRVENVTKEVYNSGKNTLFYHPASKKGKQILKANKNDGDKKYN
jgi:hypothetical protein